eukprot:sb/3473940/
MKNELLNKKLIICKSYQGIVPACSHSLFLHNYHRFGGTARPGTSPALIIYGPPCTYITEPLRDIDTWCDRTRCLCRQGVLSASATQKRHCFMITISWNDWTNIDYICIDISFSLGPKVNPEAGKSVFSAMGHIWPAVLKGLRPI